MLAPLILIVGLLTFLLAFGVTGFGLIPALVMSALLALVTLELFRFFRPKWHAQ